MHSPWELFRCEDVEEGMGTPRSEFESLPRIKDALQKIMHLPQESSSAISGESYWRKNSPTQLGSELPK